MNPAGATDNSGGGCAAADHRGVARAWYGAAPPASRLLRIADATALRAGLDPGDLCGPCGRKHGQATPAPRHARATPSARSPHMITTTEVSTVRGDCHIRKLWRELVGGVHREGGLADPSHPTYRINAHHRSEERR